MAEFRVLATEEPMTRAGVQGELQTTIDGHPVQIILTWAMGVGVSEWWVIEETGQVDVSWAMNPILVARAAAEVIDVHGGVNGAGSFEWSPPVEFGVAFGEQSPGRFVDVDRLSEETARKLSAGSGKPLVARIAAGPWTRVTS